MLGNTSILWEAAPKIEVLPAPDSDLSFDHVSVGEWNGPMYRVLNFSATQLRVVPSSYGHLAAARCGQDLSKPLFLAVSGVTRIGPSFVLGRRGSSVSDSGVWEFAPAGGVQDFPVEQQILHEAIEELSLGSGDVEVGCPVALYADSTAFTADLIIPLRVNLSAGEFQSRFVSGEYDQIAVIDGDQLREFFQENSSGVALVTEFIVTLIESGVITTLGHRDVSSS